MEPALSEYRSAGATDHAISLPAPAEVPGYPVQPVAKKEWSAMRRVMQLAVSTLLPLVLA